MDGTDMARTRRLGGFMMFQRAALVKTAVLSD